VRVTRNARNGFDLKDKKLAFKLVILKIGWFLYFETSIFINPSIYGSNWILAYDVL